MDRGRRLETSQWVPVSIDENRLFYSHIPRERNAFNRRLGLEGWEEWRDEGYPEDGGTFWGWHPNSLKLTVRTVVPLCGDTKKPQNHILQICDVYASQLHPHKTARQTRLFGNVTKIFFLHKTWFCSWLLKTYKLNGEVTVSRCGVTVSSLLKAHIVLAYSVTK